MHVKKQQLELNIEQWTVSKMGNEQAKALFCHLAYLNYMQSTSYQLDEVEVVIKVAVRNINNLRYTEDTILTAEIEVELKNLLMKVKEESETSGFTSTFRK